MMGVSPLEAGRLPYWHFIALRHEWNERHKVDDPAGDPVEPPTVEQVRASQAELFELGIAGKALH